MVFFRISLSIYIYVVMNLHGGAMGYMHGMVQINPLAILASVSCSSFLANSKQHICI
jgi:hypothetical protein